MRTQSKSVFQPALPMRGVTGERVDRDHARLISTRTPHAGSDEQVFQRDLLVDISTRTPHAGSDTAQLLGGDGRLVISTRTPHAGSDQPLRQSRPTR